MPKGQNSRYNYGKPFTLDGKKVMYRYTDKKKSTKVLVDSKKRIVKRTRGDSYRFTNKRSK